MPSISSRTVLSYLTLFLCAGSVLALPTNGELMQERSEIEERARTPVQVSYYSSLVAFGASYTDNAHARASQYSGSLRNYAPYSNYGGRYTNGPVAVEYMVSSGTTPNLVRSGRSALNLVDYAYGGSQIDNSLTYGSSPATKDQIAQYLSDVSSNTISIGTGRTLHYVNTGINSLTAIWLNAYNAGLTSASISTAKAAVTSNANALFSQLRSINTNAGVRGKSGGVDFLIAGIPPLEIVPTFGFQCNNNAAALSLLKDLASQYNAALQSFVGTFRTEMTSTSKVFYFDMAALFYDMHASPAKYGITASPVTKTCYNSATGGVCSNPSQYIYFDTLHPVTSVMSLMAQKMNTIVNARY